MMVCGGGFILASSGWWWVVVGLFGVVVGRGGFISVVVGDVRHFSGGGA